MSPDPRELWQRLQERRLSIAGVELEASRMDFADDFFAAMAEPCRKAFDAMQELEAGSVANPDEERRVGHYWLRAPELAPTPEIRQQIEDCLADLKGFAEQIREGAVEPQTAGAFRHFLLVGVGGSALGPQFVADALGSGGSPGEGALRPLFFDNTDPDGMDRVLAELGDDLAETLTIVVSKSGGTKETRNGMIEAAAAYARAGLSFAPHAVAVTRQDSELDQLAREQGWLRRFPMWDWVGGRTSEVSAVGLLPALLEGIDIDGLLRGAREMDAATRQKVSDPRQNIAMFLALCWYHATGGQGLKDMVVIPYKDRLALFSRYLQQLIMESLGKELDLDGKAVHQGIAVYGNKGSTDQHSYIQQLREGVHNFFVTFIEVLKDREGPSVEVEPGATSGDYLLGFLLGTREALYEKGRESITLTVEAVTAETVGALIALYERAVGFYASLVHVNAYHQPGVEAGKKAAQRALDLQLDAMAELRQLEGKGLTAEEVAAAIGAPEAVETLYRILSHLAANGRGVQREGGDSPGTVKFVFSSR